MYFLSFFNQLLENITNKIIIISFPGALFTLFYCYINNTSAIYCFSRSDYILLYNILTAYGIYVAMYF